jgi:hypothetical protein
MGLGLELELGLHCTACADESTDVGRLRLGREGREERAGLFLLVVFPRGDLKGERCSSYLASSALSSQLST